jgi:hypothetical protein
MNCLSDDAHPCGPAVAGASHVLLTDLAENVARMDTIIKHNAQALDEAGATVEANALPWGDLDAVHEVAPHGCDLILGAGLHLLLRVP